MGCRGQRQGKYGGKDRLFIAWGISGSHRVAASDNGRGHERGAQMAPVPPGSTFPLDSVTTPRAPASAIFLYPEVGVTGRHVNVQLRGGRPYKTFISVGVSQATVGGYRAAGQMTVVTVVRAGPSLVSLPASTLLKCLDLSLVRFKASPLLTPQGYSTGAKCRARNTQSYGE